MASHNQNKVFLGGFPVDQSEEDFYSYMSQFGVITNWKLIMENGKSKGYGFVTFKNKKDANAAKQAEHVFRGKKMECNLVYVGQLAKKYRDDIKSRKIFVSRVPFTLDERELEALFKQYGPVERVIINREHVTNKSRGSGFIIFKETATAQEVLEGNRRIRYGMHEIQVMPCLLQEEINKHVPAGYAHVEKNPNNVPEAFHVSKSYVLALKVETKGVAYLQKHRLRNSNLRLNISLKQGHPFVRSLIMQHHILRI